MRVVGKGALGSWGLGLGRTVNGVASASGLNPSAGIVQFLPVQCCMIVAARKCGAERGKKLP